VRGEMKSKRAINGYIFVCSKNTESECFKESLFGSGKAYGPAVLRIKRGDVLFLNNLDEDILYGVLEQLQTESEIYKQVL